MHSLPILMFPCGQVEVDDIHILQDSLVGTGDGSIPNYHSVLMNNVWWFNSNNLYNSGN